MAVEFYRDYFKDSISDIDVKRLQQILAFVPTAIIYSGISDYEVNWRVGFWGWQNNQVFRLPTWAWNWEKVQEELEASGYGKKESLRTIREVIVGIHKLLAAFLADGYYLYIEQYRRSENGSNLILRLLNRFSSSNGKFISRN
ncbi:hypothetical protein [Microseira wollei]|uniref:WD40 domain-containing protein n=1 Tax=Microseira wollei NIES-4236 TaxID=2530354 RepID=A0AAV3XL43_9CYAN|nr:hypothetical protein [Microseira wollei]GET40870.1 WD40 domain-containing protein [Microseira wollei NIES-4236]